MTSSTRRSPGSDAHLGEIHELVATHTTQTNEVRRTTVTLPALGLIAMHSGRPLALLEVGASAGLNLLVDRYGFRIGSVMAGIPGSPVQLRCAAEGALRPPVPDQVRSPGGAASTCIRWTLPIRTRGLGCGRWSGPSTATGWSSSTRRPRAGTPLDPPAVVPGDLTDDLPALAAEAPSQPPLVVTDTWVLAYVTPERRLDFVRALRRTATERGQPLWLVSCESHAVLASLELGIGQAPEGSSAGLSALSLHRFDPDGASRHDLLADCHAHGRWLRWLDPGTAAPGRGGA